MDIFSPCQEIEYEKTEKGLILAVYHGMEESEYSCAVKPSVRQAGNRLSGPTGTDYASLLA